MEEKELKVTPPEGYEIDRENSTFEVIKFKPKKYLYYKDICDAIFKEQVSTLDITCFCISTSFVKPRGNEIYWQINAYLSSQLEKIIAINQLFNISMYYNGNYASATDDSSSVSFVIIYNKNLKKYAVDYYCDSKTGMPFFKNEKDAEAVIDNPNFRNILDTIFKQ